MSSQTTTEVRRTWMKSLTSSIASGAASAFKTLELSTHHITTEDALTIVALRARNDRVFSPEISTDLISIYVPPGKVAAIALNQLCYDGFSIAFWQLIKHAQANGYQKLVFGRHLPVDRNIPKMTFQ